MIRLRVMCYLAQWNIETLSKMIAAPLNIASLFIDPINASQNDTSVSESSQRKAPAAYRS